MEFLLGMIVGGALVFLGFILLALAYSTKSAEKEDDPDGESDQYDWLIGGRMDAKKKQKMRNFRNFTSSVADWTLCEEPDRPPDYFSFCGSAYWDMGIVSED